MTGLRKYFRNQVIENVVFLRISPPQISPLFLLHKLYNSYNLFSANRAFPLHVVLFVSKNFSLNVYALLALRFAIKYPSSDLIYHESRPPERYNIHKKQKNISIAIKSFIGLWKRRKIF